MPLLTRSLDILYRVKYLHQINPVALAHLGERQTEVQSLNLEVLCSIHRSDTSFGAWQVQDSSILFCLSIGIYLALVLFLLHSVVFACVLASSFPLTSTPPDRRSRFHPLAAPLREFLPSRPSENAVYHRRLVDSAYHFQVYHYRVHAVSIAGLSFIIERHLVSLED
jgi:hypothetical protein